MNHSRSPTDWRGRHVTVMGLGSFGGGSGAVRYLVQQGAIVTVTDLRSREQLQESLASLAQTPPDRWVLGEHVPADFTETDCVVVNPGVPKSSPFLKLALEAGVCLSSELNLFWERNPAPVIGVTGSNGKSTTTAMIHHILKSSGSRAWLGGNIGGSLLTELDQIRSDDWVVLELSSFQLEDLDRLQVSPYVAVVTNFTPNHLDRHGTLEEYRRAKQVLLNWQSPTDLVVLNSDDPDVVHWPTHGRVLNFGLTDRGNHGVFRSETGDVVCRMPGADARVCSLNDCLSVPGEHNLMNAMAATCVGLSLGVSLSAVQDALRAYRALPHRLEFVVERSGRKFFNDSLATTPESAQHALRAFHEPVILFAGGYDKGSDLAPLAEAIMNSTVKAVALMGTTGPALGRMLEEFDHQRRVRWRQCENFAEAFEWATGQSDPGDVLLLSPGCASFDWFQNFADRGHQYCDLARSWGGNPASGNTIRD